MTLAIFRIVKSMGGKSLGDETSRETESSSEKGEKLVDFELGFRVDGNSSWAAPMVDVSQDSVDQ